MKLRPAYVAHRVSTKGQEDGFSPEAQQRSTIDCNQLKYSICSYFESRGIQFMNGHNAAINSLRTICLISSLFIGWYSFAVTNSKLDDQSARQNFEPERIYNLFMDDMVEFNKKMQKDPSYSGPGHANLLELLTKNPNWACTLVYHPSALKMESFGPWFKGVANFEIIRHGSNDRVDVQVSLQVEKIPEEITWTMAILNGDRTLYGLGQDLSNAPVDNVDRVHKRWAQYSGLGGYALSGPMKDKLILTRRSESEPFPQIDYSEPENLRQTRRDLMVCEPMPVSAQNIMERKRQFWSRVQIIYQTVPSLG